MVKVDIHKTIEVVVKTYQRVCYLRDKLEFIHLHRETFFEFKKLIDNNPELYQKSHKTLLGITIINEIRKTFNYSLKTYNYDILNSFYKTYKSTIK